MKRLFKFALVGGVGFLVDMSVFTVAYQLIEMHLMTARIIAFLLAATTTWLGNRLYTFRAQYVSSAFKQWQKFLTVACISAVPNLAIFKLLTVLIGTEGLAVYIALISGILAGMLSNFFLSKKWVFR